MSVKSEFPSRTLVTVTGIFFLTLSCCVMWPFFVGGGNPRAACLSHLKRCGIAALIYAPSFDDRLPPAASWMDALEPYVGTEKDPLMPRIEKSEVFACPDVRKENPTGYGYAMIDALSCKKVDDVKDPAVAVLLFDLVLLGRNAHSAYGGLPNPPRYSGTCLLFLDGHAKRIARGR